MSLHLLKSFDIHSLADRMITDIKDCWENPFDSPTVIFPDPLMENWFKLYWLQRNKDNAVLMNLRMKRLDSFLFDILKPAAGNTRLLLPEMLHLELIRELSSYEYNEKLDPELKYIFDGDKISSIRLYDFAKSLAALFIDYEITRYGWFDGTETNGNEWSGWQKSLYEKVCRNGITIDDTEYKTISGLYFNGSCKVPELKDQNRNCFVFGFSGMGQLYRKILSELGKQDGVSLHLYLQTDKLGDELSEKLGSYGAANYDEWRKYSIDSDSTPSKGLYPEFKLNSAPSRIREVEVLHSEICRIINGNKNISFNDIKVFAPDIKEYIPAVNLVFGEPMIPEDEVEKKRADAKQTDCSFGITYTINDYSSALSYTAEALKTLVGIEQKRFFSRVDFLSLIKNPVIQLSYGINEDDVSAWTDWIDQMNIFRRRETDRLRDDWIRAKQRLLLSRITDLKTRMGNETEIMPFDTNKGNECISGFASLVDDLYEWIEVTAKEVFTCSDDELSELDAARDVLRRILYPVSDSDDELSGEKAVYSRMMGRISLLNRVFRDSVINKECLILSLIDSISNVSLSQKCVSKGIEFISFRPNRVIPARYVFFLGLDSDSFPGIDTKSILDRRKTKQAADDSVQGKNKNAFLCQIFATSDCFCMSYVNKNLKKDESLYPSVVVNDVVSAKGIVDFSSGIDEDGNEIWDMYTFRRLRNCRTLYAGGKRKRIEKDDSKGPKQDKNAITINQLRSFLAEPFRYQAEKAFAADNNNEIEELEFEPIDLDNLMQSILRKEYLAEQDENKIKEDLIARDILPDFHYGDAQFDQLIDSLKTIRRGFCDMLSISSEHCRSMIDRTDALRNERKKTRSNITRTRNSLADQNSEKQMLLEELIDKEKEQTSEIENLQELISGEYNDLFFRHVVGESRITLENREKMIPVSIDGNNTVEVSGKCCWFNPDYIETGCLMYADIKRTHNLKDYLNAYVSSLILLAEKAGTRESRNESSSVALYLIDPVDGKVDCRLFSIKLGEAVEQLRKIVSSAIGCKTVKCFPIDVLEDKAMEAPDYQDLADYVLKEHGPWSYFAKSKLIDISEGLGYDLEDIGSFSAQWESEKKKAESLVSYLLESDSVSEEDVE